MELTGWGKYPVIDSEIITPRTPGAIAKFLADNESSSFIPRGLGRSYGDSALAQTVLGLTMLNHFRSFDRQGILTCGAGVSLGDILRLFVPRGWFLRVTPGTKFVTIGGAIASDVHGKNHHVEGCFSEHLISFRLILPSGEKISCSREENGELFHATCGGMGLTGIITDATFRLKSIKSAFIREQTIKAANLDQALELIKEHGQTTYSVAWIDCLATGSRLGRSLLMLGEHAETGGLTPGRGRSINVPVDLPDLVLNRCSIQAFNTIYFHRIQKKHTERVVHYEPFFFPLDGLHNWNRIYGKKGFAQYQFVLPKPAGPEGISVILKRIARSGRGSFLAVLKAFGKANANHLSFPMEGFTLALDFKLGKGLFPLLDELDRIVLDYGGRLYLSKDVRMSETTFKKSYPQWERFMEIRKKHGADRTNNSLQSKRLGI